MKRCFWRPKKREPSCQNWGKVGWDGMGGTMAHCCITAYSKDCKRLFCCDGEKKVLLDAEAVSRTFQINLVIRSQSLWCNEVQLYLIVHKCCIGPHQGSFQLSTLPEGFSCKDEPIVYFFYFLFLLFVCFCSEMNDQSSITRPEVRRLEQRDACRTHNILI